MNNYKTCKSGFVISLILLLLAGNINKSAAQQQDTTLQWRQDSIARVVTMATYASAGKTKPAGDELTVLKKDKEPKFDTKNHKNEVALTQFQRTIAYSVASLGSGLSAYYPFTNNAFDISGNARNAVNYGAALTTDRFGNANSAYSFSGSNCYMALPGSFSAYMANNQFTVSMWVYVNSTKEYQYIFWANDDGPGIRYCYSSVQYCYKSNLTSNPPPYNVLALNYYPSSPFANWQHLVFTYSNRTFYAYANGVLVGTQVVTGDFVPGSNIRLGQDNVSARSLLGKLDDVRIYNRAITAAEVQELYGMEAGIPAAPSNLTTVAINSNRINLAWTDNSSNEILFQVERSPDDSLWTSLPARPANRDTCIDNPPLDGTKYYYRVKAVCNNLSSNWSNIASAITPLIAPTNFVANPADQSTINLSWTNNSATASSFVLSRKPKSCSFSDFETVLANVTSTIDYNLVNSTSYTVEYNGCIALVTVSEGGDGATYTYRIRAKNAITTSAEVETMVTIPLNAPVNLLVADESTTSVSLAWTANTTASGYTVYRATGDNPDWTDSFKVTPYSSTWKDINAYDGIKYWYKVRNTKETILSAWSAEVYTVTPLKAPANLTATVNNKTVTLKWTNRSASHPDYVIARKDPKQPDFAGVATFTADAYTFTDNPVTSNFGTYRYTLKAKNNLTQTAPMEISVEVKRTIQTTTDRNYIITYTAKEERTDTLGFYAAQPDTVSRQVQYFDGLGRPDQTVMVKASPTQKDMVQHIEYDAFGREAKKYMPFTLETINGQFLLDAAIHQNDFYKSEPIGLEADTFAFAETRFDNSPLNRPLEQGAPGQAWQLSQHHTLNMDYSSNISPVNHWSIDPNGTYTAYSYPVNSLYITKTTDEDQHPTEEYKDKEGKVVMKVNAISGRTIFIYDDLNRKRCVMPPKATNPNTDRGLCYYYRYDDRGRPITKQIPGADSISLVYDVRDRLVLSQDGNMRLNNKWTFIKYDCLNRPVLTGIYITTQTRNQLATMLETITAPTSLCESFTGNMAAKHGYSDNAFPVGVADNDYLTVTYYDLYTGLASKYDFKTIPELMTDATEYEGFETMKSDKTIGKITSTKTKVLNTNQWLITITYYDKYGRIIQTVGDNHKNGIDRICNKYNFTDELIATLKFHTIGIKPPIISGKLFTYDHAGRLLKTDEQVIGHSKITTSELKYNELGQLLTKGLHKTSDTTFLQNTAYKYNMRGWLRTLGSELFNMELLYYHINGFNHLTSTPNYNGNISAIKWYNKFSNFERAYGYEYDELNRLRFGKYGDGADLQQHLGFYDELINEYDENGNIRKLQRKYNSVQVDNLTLNYHAFSNQINNIVDAGNNATTFKGFPIGIASYQFDNNGNMNYDESKGVNITYNILNLPQEYTKDDAKVRYTYDAAGNKLQKIIANNAGTPVKTTDYIGGYIYENDTLRTLQTSEGRLVFVNDSTLKYEYYLKDHLGNIRCVFTDSSSVARVLQENNYYPFGASFGEINRDIINTNKFLFSGKELQNDKDHAEANLDNYDFHARWLDRYIPIFNQIDPKANMYFDISPYVSFLNNPVRYIDPQGKDIWDVLAGICVAVSDNASLGFDNRRESTNYTDAGDYQTGQTIGDVLSIALGSGEMLDGGSNIIAGGYATIQSGGTLVWAGGAAIGKGLAETGHGFGMARSATRNLMEGNKDKKNEKNEINETTSDANKKEKRVSSKTLRKKWEESTGGEWPTEPDDPNRNQSVKHKKALNDGGTNDVDNIEPQPWAEHHKEHKENGDFKRWAKNRKNNNTNTE